ncbi:MAG: DUF4153 domain-containing protein [Bacteroidales bacterium]|nr:DUF4153 domain-containing protein [Bacteroidales bacterium]
MEVLKKFNPKAVLSSALDAVKRFPIALVLIWALMCYGIYMVHASGTDKDFFFKWAYFLGSGFVLSAGLRLLSERIDDVVKSWLVRIVPLILWGGACYLLFWLMEDRDTKDLYLPLICSMSLAVLVFFFTCLFLKRDSDLQFWKFSRNVLASLSLGVFVASALFAGISLFFQILRMLFDIKVDGELFGDVAIVMYLGLMPVVALSSINTKDEIEEPLSESLSKVFDRIVHFLLLGLLALYMLSLYVYVLKILFTLELPRGWVSVLVSICMVGMLIVLFFVYPNKQLRTSKFDEALFRILPALMLPLVALMSVGIIKRFFDYGITMPRLWLLIVNLWYWAVCLYLLLSKQKRIVWLPVSFAGIFLLMSFGPWSVANITFGVLRAEVKSLSEAKNYTLPIGGDVDMEQEPELNEALHYLKCTFPREWSSDIIDSTWKYHYHNLWDDDIYDNLWDDEAVNDAPIYYTSYIAVDGVRIDRNVGSFNIISFYGITLPHAENADSIYHVDVDVSGRTFHYDVPKSQICVDNAKEIIFRNDSSMLVLNYCQLTVNPESRDDNDYLTLEGYLFWW